MKRLLAIGPPDLLSKPTEHRSTAAALTRAYQALWHPAFLAVADEPPGWSTVDAFPREGERVVAIDSATRAAAPPIVRSDLADPSVTLVVADAKAPEPGGPAALVQTLGLAEVEASLRDDFFALGFAYLGLEVLFARMGHDNPISAEEVHEHARRAAGEALARADDAARAALVSAFELLHNARQMVYPATINLIDLGIYLPGQPLEPLATRALDGSPWNLLVSGADLADLARQDSALIETFRGAIDRHELEILVGQTEGMPLALLPVESRIWHVARACHEYETHLGHEPASFGSRTHALLPDLPQLLMKFQFRHALHGAYDGGRFPNFKQPKLHWTGPDGSVVEALARVPVDGRDPASVLDFFAEIGHTTMADRAATVVIARWAHEAAQWYPWLLAVTRHAKIFGDFQTFSDYFHHSSIPDRPTHTLFEEYATGALVGAIARGAADPIGRWIDHHRRRDLLDTTQSLAALTVLAGGESVETLAALEEEVETGASGVEEKLAGHERALARRLGELVVKDTEASAGTGRGYLVVNPRGVARRLCLEVEDALEGVEVATPIRALERTGRGAAVVIDVPPWGYAWLGRSGPVDLGQGPRTTPEPGKSVPLASGRRLRNEFIEVEIDAKTGGMRGVWDTRDRYSRLGQQLVHGKGSRALCQSVEVTASGPVRGEIVTQGEIRALEGNAPLARFRQRFRLWLHRPVLEIDLHLEPLVPFKPDPSDDYLAVRWAWPDEKTIVSPANGWHLEPCRAAEFEAPGLIRLRERNLLTDIVTGGVAFHKRSGFRLLDSLLVVAGERTRDFRFLVGLNLAQPWPTLFDVHRAPVVVKVDRGPPRQGRTGWFAKLTSPNLACASLAPIADIAPSVRLRLIETRGEATRTDLRFCRRASKGRLTNLRGELIYDLHAHEQGISLDFSPYELLQVEAVL